jgi:hypothetical protein
MNEFDLEYNHKETGEVFYVQRLDHYRYIVFNPRTGVKEEMGRKKLWAQYKPNKKAINLARKRKTKIRGINKAA